MKDYNINPFLKFDKEWALVTAGDSNKFNSMTISWGSMGTLWFKNVVTIYIRPSRYTCKFLKECDTFTISFYPEEYKDKLLMFGRCSGADTDKVLASGFTPVIMDNGITYKEASETIVLKKLYMGVLNKEDMCDDVLNTYNDDDTHYMIIGEVLEIK